MFKLKKYQGGNLRALHDRHCSLVYLFDCFIYDLMKHLQNNYTRS